MVDLATSVAALFRVRWGQKSQEASVKEQQQQQQQSPGAAAASSQQQQHDSDEDDPRVTFSRRNSRFYRSMRRKRESESESLLSCFDADSDVS